MKRICRYVVLCLSLVACFSLAGQAAGSTPGATRRAGPGLEYHHVSVSGPLSARDLKIGAGGAPHPFRLAERNLPRVRLERSSSVRVPRSAPGRSAAPPEKRHENRLEYSSGDRYRRAQHVSGQVQLRHQCAPNCANDFVVFGLNVAGATAGQANLVGVNNLYSGSTRGLCGANPTVNWAYNGSTAGGSVLTSPVVSLDGNKIAYVESTAEVAIFHVLTWKAGEGTSATAAATPTLNGACTVRAAPTSSCLKSVTFSTTATDTLSSPWVDYQTDKAFVGSDDGKIYRISCVFNCALNTQSDGGLDFHSARGRHWRCGGETQWSRSMTSPAAAFSWAISSESFGSSMPAEPAPASEAGSGDDRRRRLHYDQPARAHGNAGSTAPRAADPLASPIPSSWTAPASASEFLPSPAMTALQARVRSWPR